MCSLLYSIVCCHSDQIYLTILCGSKNDNRCSKLVLKIISQITKCIHICIFYAGSKNLYAIYIYCICKSISGRILILQLGIFRCQSFDLSEHCLDLFSQLCRLCFCCLCCCF